MAASTPPAAPSPWYRSILARKQAIHGIYIEIVVLALILALEGKRSSGAGIVVAVFGAVFAILLAEIYAHYLGTMIGDGRRPTGDEFRTVVLGTLVGAVAALPPIALLMLGVSGAISLDSGFTAAKWAGVAVIGLYALLANRRAGLSMRRSIVGALVFGLVGFGLVLLKQYFH